MIRRAFLFGSAAFLLGCSGQSSTMTIQGILDELRKQCGFVTSWQPIAQLVATMVSGFNAEIGATATVAIGIANQAIIAVCGAVKSHAQMQPYNAAQPRIPMTVVINGVEIKGTYQQ